MILLGACVENTLEKHEETPSGAPAVRVEPSRLDFGNIPYGSASDLTLTVSNDGTTTLSLDALAFGGLGAGAFTLPDDPTGAVIDPGASTSFDVVFTAVAPTAEDTLRVSTNDPADPYVYVPLTGAGDFGFLEIDPSPVDFGATVVAKPITLPAMLRNIGAADLSIACGTPATGSVRDPPPTTPTVRSTRRPPTWRTAPGSSASRTSPAAETRTTTTSRCRCRGCLARRAERLC